MSLSAYNNMALPGRIVTEFDFSGFFENLPRKVELNTNMTKITGNLHAFLCSLGHAVAQWLRSHCALNRKLAGSIPDGVTGFFH
jgi:hypothetical protein